MKSPLGNLGGGDRYNKRIQFSERSTRSRQRSTGFFYSTEFPPCDALAPKIEALVNKKDEAESLTTLCEIQEPEDKWFVNFKQMGMKGVR